MGKVYIAGPMTGLKENNYPAFNAAARVLRRLGFVVLNPAENPPPRCGTWEGWMRMSIRQVSDCDYIHLLPGWWRSRGARVEALIAWVLGIPRLRIGSGVPY